MTRSQRTQTKAPIACEGARVDARGRILLLPAPT